MPRYMEFTAKEMSDGEHISTKRVIITDVDETICETCHLITPEMAKTIDNLIRKGYTFAFISGTDQGYLQQMISSQLREKHFLLATTGTRCIEIKPDQNEPMKEVYNYQLTDSEKKEIIAALEKLITRFNIQTLTTKDDQIQNRGTQITLSAIGRHAPLELKKAYDPDAQKRKEFILFLRNILDENKYEITYGGTTSIDITRKGLDKSWGIKRFAEHHKIALQNILFLGDRTNPGGNDYAATKVVDYITVRNPLETLKVLKQFIVAPMIDKRQWGNFKQFTYNEISTVKILEVHPGKRLSLQSHQQREELWVALDDGAIIEIGDESRTLKSGEAVFIPTLTKHRLSSQLKTVRVLEISFGNFDEGDITRYEDDFNRV